jgi:hypothetical protein
MRAPCHPGFVEQATDTKRINPQTLARLKGLGIGKTACGGKFCRVVYAPLTKKRRSFAPSKLEI